MTKTKEPTCSGCAYWFRTTRDELAEIHALVGVCRRHAPTGENSLAQTQGCFWCGDYVNKVSLGDFLFTLSDAEGGSGRSTISVPIDIQSKYGPVKR